MVNLLSKPGYSKCSKILNTFLFLPSNKMWVIRAGILKTLVRIANSEDPDQANFEHCFLGEKAHIPNGKPFKSAWIQ